MSPPIGQSVKQKVIELYTNGYSSSYDITDELNKQGINKTRPVPVLVG